MSIVQDPAKTADSCDSDIGQMTVNMLPERRPPNNICFLCGGNAVDEPVGYARACVSKMV
jgi:hypothetical protein